MPEEEENLTLKADKLSKEHALGFVDRNGNHFVDDDAEQKIAGALINVGLKPEDASEDFGRKKLHNLLAFTSAFAENHHAQLTAEDCYTAEEQEQVQEQLRQQSDADQQHFTTELNKIIEKAAEGKEELSAEEKATLEIATKSGHYSDEAIAKKFSEEHEDRKPKQGELERYANTLRMNEFMAITSSKDSPFDGRFNQVKQDLSDEEKKEALAKGELVEKEVKGPGTGEPTKKLFTTYKPPEFPGDDKAPKFNHVDPPPYLKTGALAALAGFVNAMESFDTQLAKAEASTNPGPAFAMAFLFLFAGLTVNMALAIANGTKTEEFGDVGGVVPLKKKELLDSLKAWTDFQNQQRDFHKELLKEGTFEEVERAEPAQKNKALSKVIDKTNAAVQANKDRQVTQGAAVEKPKAAEEVAQAMNTQDIAPELKGDARRNLEGPNTAAAHRG